MTRTLGDTLRLSTVVSVWSVEIDSLSVVSISPKIDNYYGSSVNHQSLVADLGKLSQAMHLSCQQVTNSSGMPLSHILVG